MKVPLTGTFPGGGTSGADAELGTKVSLFGNSDGQWAGLLAGSRSAPWKISLPALT